MLALQNQTVRARRTGPPAGDGAQQQQRMDAARAGPSIGRMRPLAMVHHRTRQTTGTSRTPSGSRRRRRCGPARSSRWGSPRRTQRSVVDEPRLSSGAMGDHHQGDGGCRDREQAARAQVQCQGSSVAASFFGALRCQPCRSSRLTVAAFAFASVTRTPRHSRPSAAPRTPRLRGNQRGALLLVDEHVQVAALGGAVAKTLPRTKRRVVEVRLLRRSGSDSANLRAWSSFTAPPPLNATAKSTSTRRCRGTAC